MKTAMKMMAALLLIFGSTAMAQIEKPQATGYAGLLLGYADPTNMDGRLGYGADIGLMFPGGLTGLVYFYNSKDKTNNVDVSGGIHVHTQATDADGIARSVGTSMKGQMRDAVANFDDGVAN